MEGKFEKLERPFNPRSVVVIGDKRENNNYSFLWAQATFSGNVYSLNVDPGESPGI